MVCGTLCVLQHHDDSVLGLSCARKEPRSGLKLFSESAAKNVAAQGVVVS